MLAAISIIICAIAMIYALFILYANWYWNRIAVTDIEHHKIAEQVEVIIPIKNEALTLRKTLKSVFDNNQTVRVVTVIDDGSQDDSRAIAEQSLRPSDKLLTTHTDQRGKKHAINLAVNTSDADIILTTDGDCVVSQQWVQSLSSTLSKTNNDLVLGPVFIENPKELIGHFQQFDFVATMAISQLAHVKKWFFSGSATSMAYRREYFNQLNPYKDNIQIPSGDDIFLIEKVMNSGGQIEFIKNKNTFVLTKALTDWKALWNQRLRWAGKSKHYDTQGIKLFWMFISMALLAFCASPFLLSSSLTISAFFCVWLFKGIVDLLLIRSLVNFYKLEINYWYFIPCLFIYPFFIVGVGIRSIFNSHQQW